MTIEEKLKIVEISPSKYQFKTKDNEKVSIEHKNNQLVLSLYKWGEEASLKIPLNMVLSNKHTFIDNKIEIETTAFKLRIYPIDTRSTREFYGDTDDFIQCQDGGARFELVLKNKPLKNSFTIPIVAKNLRFSYQPFLTEEEINQGIIRPLNVEDSYAVYHISKRNNKYKTGKAFHVYRPIAEDALGNKAWCIIRIDKPINPTSLTITVPQQFLDEATYPITIDPDLGYTTDGSTDYKIGSYTSLENQLRGSAWQIPATGLLSWIRAYIGGDEVCNCKTMIFEKDSGGAGIHDRRVEPVTILDCAINYHWEEFTFAGQTLTQGTNYIPAIIGESSLGKNNNYYIKGDENGALASYWQQQDYANPPDPWTKAADGTTIDHSIYCRYIVPPTVTTQAATDVLVHTATLNGNIIDTGDEDVDERGFEWDIDSGAPYANDWTESSGPYGTGAFTHGLTGLIGGKTYYYRSKAHNSAGWSYGEEQSFTMDTPTLPTNKIWVVDKENNVFRIEPSDLSEEKTKDIS